MGEPISPELVSVDPELAAAARAALPEEPWQMFSPAPAPHPAATERLGAPRRSLRGPGIALAFVAAAVAGIVVGSTDAFKRANDSPSFAAEPPPAAAPSVAATTGVTATVAPPSVTATAAATPELAPAPTTPTRRPAPTKSTAEGTFVPSRTFAWAPVSGADRYRVRFYRDGRVVLEGRAEQPRFVVPPRFEFRPGAYRWTVEPRRGEAYGSPVVDSRFEVGD